MAEAMPDPKPIPTREHRRAAAEALCFYVPPHYRERFERWLDDGDVANLGWSSAKRATDLTRVAQAIAAEGARAAAAERALLLADCRFFDVDFNGDITEHDSLDDAQDEAEAALEAALDEDSSWSERTGDIGYGALIYLGRATETNRREAPEGSGFDELVDYVLKTTEVSLIGDLALEAAEIEALAAVTEHELKKARPNA
jgi:hypothetical protein